MGRIERHLRLAKRNQATLGYLVEALDEHPEWVATVAFYRAVQIAEALLVHITGEGSSDHGDRHRRLKSTNQLHNVWKHYRVLFSAARIARYLVGEDGGEYEQFSDYMSPQQVKSELLDHRLAQVEKSAKKLLGENHAKLI